jgi:hypothetical protein
VCTKLVTAVLSRGVIFASAQTSCNVIYNLRAEYSDTISTCNDCINFGGLC